MEIAETMPAPPSPNLNQMSQEETEELTPTPTNAPNDPPLNQPSQEVEETNTPPLLAVSSVEWNKAIQESKRNEKTSESENRN